MTIRTLSQGLRASASSYDVCVVGGGIAGLLVAQRLARTSRLRVVVVESGGLVVTDEAQQLNDLSDDGDDFTSASDGRFRALGGSSTRWGGRFMPLNPAEVGPREYLNDPGWPIDPGAWEVYRPELEEMFGLPESSYEADALDQLDPRRLLPRNDVDISVRVPKWAPYSRCDLGPLVRKTLEESSSVEVILNATVCTMHLQEDGRLASVGVRGLDGSAIEITAGQFVFAAGTVETTRLLLLADRQHEDRVFANCRALGRNLQDHLGLRAGYLDVVDHGGANRAFGYRFVDSARRSVHLELSPEAQRSRRTPAAFAHLTMEASDDSATGALRRLVRGRQSGARVRKGDLSALARSPGELIRGAWWRGVRRQHYWPPSTRQQVQVWIEQLPRPENRMSLSTKLDVFGVPKARIDWSIGEQEDRTFRAYIAVLSEFWRRRGLDALCRLDLDGSVIETEATLSRVAFPVYHPSGTTRMGIDSVTSVVDPDLRCHQIPNVRVVSASVFPTAGGAGPTYTVGLMALAVAADLAKEMR